MPDLTRNEMHEVVKRIDENVAEIKKQVLLTNGRVRKLEVWRGFITGGLTIVSIVVGYLLKHLG